MGNYIPVYTEIDNPSHPNFAGILDFLARFPDEQSCIDYLTALRWGGHIVSPFDPDSKVYVCKNNRYRCKNTKKYFNVKTRTMFENSKVKLRKWFLAIYLITAHKKGISSLQLHRDLQLTQKTAWFLLHRIRNCFGKEYGPMLGIVEVDEAYPGGKEKNKHFKNRNPHPQSLSHKSTVMGIAERNGVLKAKVIPSPSTANIIPEILRNVAPGTVVVTDQYNVYKRLAGYYEHQSINHAAGEYVKGDAHTNTIEGFWSLLKRGIIGIYHFTSHEHLQLYVDEFVFRYNTRNISEAQRFEVMLKRCGNRLRYQTLINGEEKGFSKDGKSNTKGS